MILAEMIFNFFLFLPSRIFDQHFEAMFSIGFKNKKIVLQRKSNSVKRHRALVFTFSNIMLGGTSTLLCTQRLHNGKAGFK